MWIKLVSPRMNKRPMDSNWKIRMTPSLSLLVLGALTPEEHNVTIMDENAERTVLDDSPDLVGITVKTNTFRRSCEIAAAYRARGIPVVFGGIHPTVDPESCLPHADAVVVGDAEVIWRKLLRDAGLRQLKPVYRNDGPVDIALTPIPRWDLLQGKDYLFNNTLCIGRGCPWRCDFCYNSSDNMDAHYRMKPIPHILREIESLNVDHVMFIDDNFIGDPAAARLLLKELARMRITWHTAVSTDIGRHEDILDLMAASGCKTLFIGFESVNQKSLLTCHKVQNRTERYVETIAKIHARGIMVNASLVFGFDEDDESVFSSTLDWLVRNRLATMTAHILTPYPGTRLYKKLLAEGRIVDFDLSHYNTDRAVFQPKLMSRQELENGHRRIYREFYSLRNIWLRRPTCADQLVAYLEFSFLYKKLGNLTYALGSSFGLNRLFRVAKRFAYPSRRQAGVRPAPGLSGAFRRGEVVQARTW